MTPCCRDISFASGLLTVMPMFDSVDEPTDNGMWILVGHVGMQHEDPLPEDSPDLRLLLRREYNQPSTRGSHMHPVVRRFVGAGPAALSVKHSNLIRGR